jgi:16S rRNA (adenine1518-N6/adenine1519-N6)-dimethyltransferase
MPHHEPHRQTQSYLAGRLAERGVRIVPRLGQNFLVDLNLHTILVDAAELRPTDVVLEVGTGIGSLTALLAARAAWVVSIEIDPRLHQLASEELHTVGNVTLLCGDALRSKNALSDELLGAVDARLADRPGAELKLVANLPYQVATPVVTNLLALDRPPRSMTVTIQKELAERIVASPGTKDFGSLAIWVQSQARSRIVRLLPPSVFWPRPKVQSAIVHIELDDALRERIADRPAFQQFVRALFLHRRKHLRASLALAVADRLNKAQSDDILARLGLPPDMRAEQLEVAQVLALHDAVQETVGSRLRAEPG